MSAPAPDRAAEADRAQILPLAASIPIVGAWRDLAAATGLTFAGPDMPLAAAGRIEPAGWDVLVLPAAGGRLDAALPFRLKRLAPGVGPRFAEGFWSHFGPASALAIRDGRADIAGRLLDRLSSEASVLRLRWQATDDPSFRALAAAALARGGTVLARNEHRRAALLRIPEPLGGLLAGGGARELRRQWRRLGEQGELVHTVASGPADLSPAMDAFLRLEASGWKGRQGSALDSDRSRRDFAMELVEAYGRAGGCRIDLLSLDGRPVAGLVTLRRGTAAATWKIAYDEDLARFSPGAQVLRLASDTFVADGTLAAVDSLARPGHPLLDRAWAGRIAMADVVLATSSRALPLARALVGRMDAEAALRAFAVRARSRLRPARR